METLKSSSSYNKSKTFSLGFFCAGLVFKGFCFYAWGCVQGEGENDVVELNLLVGKLSCILLQGVVHQVETNSRVQYSLEIL